MTDAPLLKPKLYKEGAPPSLRGGACACGYVFFPMQSYGCERCGSLSLSERALRGEGVLLASTRVHLHAGKARTAPFTVGSIRLDDGPIVRTVLVDDGGPLRPGDRMIALFEDVRDAEGGEKRDLRFRKQD